MYQKNYDDAAAGLSRLAGGRMLGGVGQIGVEAQAEPADAKLWVARQAMKRALLGLEVEYAKLAVKRAEIALQAAHDGILFDGVEPYASGEDLRSHTKRCELNLDRARLVVREQELEFEESEERQQRLSRRLGPQPGAGHSATVTVASDKSETISVSAPPLVSAAGDGAD